MEGNIQGSPPPTAVDSELELSIPKQYAAEEEDSDSEYSETSSDSNEWIDPQDNEIATYPKMAANKSCASWISSWRIFLIIPSIFTSPPFSSGAKSTEPTAFLDSSCSTVENILHRENSEKVSTVTI